jgi:predicted ester cyclase
MDAKAVVRGYLLEAIGEGRWDAWPRYVHDDAVFNGRPMVLPVMQRMREDLRAAVPDFRIVIEEQLVDGDRVATRVTFTGTRDGEHRSTMGIAIDELRDGRVARMWHVADPGRLAGRRG